MKLQDAHRRLIEHIGKPINTEGEVSTNKGAVGISLEKFLGLKQGNNPLDFEDGELKTFHLNERGAVKEDFRICSKWDKEYIKAKIANILVVGINTDNIIVFCEVIHPLEHPIYSKYFDEEVDKILEKGPTKCSQKDTEIWIAKTQGRGHGSKSRSLYISRPAAHYLFYGEYPKGGRKARKVLVGN